MVTFKNGKTLTWEELKNIENGNEFGYKAEAITDTEIGEEAFNDCRNLVSITIPETVEEIGVKAFSGCRLKSATFQKTDGWTIKKGKKTGVLDPNDVRNNAVALLTFACTRMRLVNCTLCQGHFYF